MAMITTQTNIPTHTPALKISPITWQPEKENKSNSKEMFNIFFIKKDLLIQK